MVYKSRLFIILVLLALATVLTAVKGIMNLGKTGPDDRNFDLRVNLALRQTADRLLDLDGASTKTIPPVTHTGPAQYRLRLERNFNYDSLPRFLETALTRHGIQTDYLVSVAECGSEEIVLGFARADVLNGVAPCVGRDLVAGCYELTLVFPDTGDLFGASAAFWSLVLAMALLGVAALVFYRRKKRVQAALDTNRPPSAAGTILHFGQSAFDPANQSLQVGNARQTLTYREAKLLRYFLHHPNQVLSREAILAAVWEDEGIMVGRSLDVFVSRLRKLLRPDATVALTAVHGVGYKLEVAG